MSPPWMPAIHALRDCGEVNRVFRLGDPGSLTAFRQELSIVCLRVVDVVGKTSVDLDVAIVVARTGLSISVGRRRLA